MADAAPPLRAIDLNVDCGESFGVWTLGEDALVLRHVTSANIACGGHAGDPLVMRRTLRLCRELGVSAGAHPGYPDVQGFGRRALPMSPEEIAAHTLAQLGALDALARAEGVSLTHVKPHGALYNQAAARRDVADALAWAVAAFDRRLILVGLAGSHLIEAGRAAGLPVAREAFVDRAYEADGSLRARHLPGALIASIARSVEQALSIALRGEVVAHDGTRVSAQADTLCIHGDAPDAPARAEQVRRALEQAGVAVRFAGASTSSAAGASTRPLPELAEGSGGSGVNACD